MPHVQITQANIREKADLMLDTRRDLTRRGLQRSLTQLLADPLMYALIIQHAPLLAFNANFLNRSSDLVLMQRLILVRDFLRGLTQSTYTVLVHDDFRPALVLDYTGYRQHNHFAPDRHPQSQGHMHGHGSSFNSASRAPYNPPPSYYASGHTSFQPPRSAGHSRPFTGHAHFENDHRGPGAHGAGRGHGHG